MSADPNYVTIQCDDPPGNVTALLGMERPDVSAGYGGWEEVERPRRSTVTSWKGQPARRLSLSILLDNLVEGRSIEGDIRRLERMALPRPDGPPPTVTLAAVGGVIPWKSATWVIDGIAWGDALMNSHGNRVRQAATITFLQYVSDELLQASPAKKRRKQKRDRDGAVHGVRVSAKKKRYVVKRGQTLRSIAAKELGNSKYWTVIADLNNLRDPRSIKVGQTLRLP